jgi:hypothetical protein
MAERDEQWEQNTFSFLATCNESLNFNFFKSNEPSVQKSSLWILMENVLY